MKARCVFLDRDGVINLSPPPHDYVHTWREFKFIPGIVDWIRLFNSLDFLVIVVTNQRGVARGLVTPDDLAEIHHNMRAELAKEGARIDDVFCCPHEEQSCDCRKPRPGLIVEAQRKWNIDLAASILIGDTDVDQQLARKCGLGFIRVFEGRVVDSRPRETDPIGVSLVSIIVPTHNEVMNVGPLYQRIAKVFGALPRYEFELIFCDDSDDETPAEIARLNQEDRRVKLVRLSRKFGQAIAIAAGIDRCGGEAAILMDADLQDPPEAIPQLLELWRLRNDVVYVERESSNNYLGYRLFSFVFYRILRKMASVRIPVDAGEYRLLDRKVVEFLKRVTEHSRFLRGLTVWPGFRIASIKIQRAPRLQGKTNYNFRRALLVALDGIIGFSIVPLRLVTLFGAAVTLCSFLAGVAYIVARIIYPTAFGAGWTSLFVSLFFMGGIQLISLGIIGEYVGRIFVEVQNRPVYWVEYELGFNGQAMVKSAGAK